MRRAVVVMHGVLVASMLLAAQSPAHAQQVTVLTAARIHTMEAAQPLVQAMAYDAGGKILALDDADALMKRYRDAKRIDAGTATVIPGLIDAHGHLVGLGTNRWRQLNLYSSKSRAETIERLKAFDAQLPKGAWLYGRGWRSEHWTDGGPTAAELDALFTGRAVWLERSDRRAGWASSAAFKAFAAASAGGAANGVVRDAKAKPTGIIEGKAAMDHMLSVMTPIDDATLEKGLRLAMQEAAAAGLTGVHEAGISIGQLRVFQRMADRGELPIRITAWAEDAGASLDWLCHNGAYQHPSQRLKMRSVRFIVDGSTGNRTSWMLEDYSDQPGWKGELWIQPQPLRAMMRKARDCGVQVAAEALGDAGNRVTLDAMADVLGADAAKDHRWRIEHAQLLTPQDLPRFAQLGVIASMQPTHPTSDVAWIEDRIGPHRKALAYAWRSMRDTGAHVALGSDFPLETHDPRAGLHSAVMRRNVDNLPQGGWTSQQKLTAYEALRGYTLEAAFAGFAEAEVGSLREGKRADFVVVERDPLAIPGEELRKLGVLATYVDGRAVYVRSP